MGGISVTHQPSEAELEERGVRQWSIWTCEPSRFPWSYEERETCYLLEGEVVVTPDGGDPVTIQSGDLVVFPRGMSCTWDVKRAVRKHYIFG